MDSKANQEKADKQLAKAKKEEINSMYVGSHAVFTCAQACV